MIIDSYENYLVQLVWLYLVHNAYLEVEVTLVMMFDLLN